MSLPTKNGVVVEVGASTGTAVYGGNADIAAGRVLADVEALATGDAPLQALDLIADRLRRDPRLHPYLDPVAAQLRARTAHLKSRETYAAFYNEESGDRFTSPERVQALHDVMPRWGLVRQQMLMHKQRRVVELACFDGFNLVNYALTSPGGVHCVGVDTNRAAIAEARQKAAKLGVAAQCQFVESMVEDVRLDAASFDAVLVLEILEHVIDPQSVLEKAESLVTPGGHVYVSMPLSAPPHTEDRARREHVRLFDADAMRALLSAPGRELVWYCQLPSDGHAHHCGAYRVVTQAGGAT